jgi:hypothetical protein
MLVEQKRWTAHESGCDFLSVRTTWDRQKESWPVSHIRAKCSGESCTWRSDFVLYYSKGALYIRGRNTKETCDG